MHLISYSLLLCIWFLLTWVWITLASSFVLLSLAPVSSLCYPSGPSNLWHFSQFPHSASLSCVPMLRTELLHMLLQDFPTVPTLFTPLWLGTPISTWQFLLILKASSMVRPCETSLDPQSRVLSLSSIAFLQLYFMFIHFKLVQNLIGYIMSFHIHIFCSV